MKHAVIDARIIETSTGRYIQRIVEGLNDQYFDSTARYTVLVPSQFMEKWQDRLPNLSVEAADYASYGLKEQISFVWRLLRLKPNLVHFAMPQQPFLWWGPSITTIHDMILVRYENIGSENAFVYRFKKLIFRALLHVVLLRAKAIISPTEYVKNDLATFFGERYRTKLYVTPLAGEIPDATPEPIRRFEDSPFLFYIGNMFPYKNVKAIIIAFREIRKKYPDLQLLLAGKKDEFALELEQFVKNENIGGVHFLGFISDGEKRWALQHARLFVTASLAEGFCIPLLEAMIEGCPVAASNASCIPEVVGDGGLLFDPSSTDSLVGLVESVLGDDDLRNELIQRGHAHAKTYSWQRTVDQTYSIYKTCL